MDEVTKNIVALEGMQDVPLPGMELVSETPEKISPQVSNANFVYRIVNAKGEVYYSNRGIWGVYDNERSAKNALAQVKHQYRWVYNVDEGKYFKKILADEGWKLEVAKVEWYDVS